MLAGPGDSLDQRNGQAVASLVFGILSVFFCWLGLLGAAMVILAVAFGAIGLLRVRLGFSSGKGWRSPAWCSARSASGSTSATVAGLGLGFRL